MSLRSKVRSEGSVADARNKFLSCALVGSIMLSACAHGKARADPSINVLNRGDLMQGAMMKKPEEEKKAIYIGGTLEVKPYTVKLADLTIPYGKKSSNAILQIYQGDKLLNELTASPGKTTVKLTEKESLEITIGKTSPGLTTAKWAEISVKSLSK